VIVPPPPGDEGAVDSPLVGSGAVDSPVVGSGAVDSPLVGSGAFVADVVAPGGAAPVVGAGVVVPRPVLHAAANMSAAPNTPRYLSFMCAITSSGNSSSMRPRHLRSAFAPVALAGSGAATKGRVDRRDPDRWPKNRYLPAQTPCEARGRIAHASGLTRCRIIPSNVSFATDVGAPRATGLGSEM